jgi:hypothetical protein
MNGDLRTALVVMHPGSGVGSPAVRSEETASDPADVSEVLAWFQERGFETGPVVGISFSISGSHDLFRDVLGDTSALDASEGGELPLDALREDVAAHVAAIAVTAPPDFGPGNP